MIVDPIVNNPSKRKTMVKKVLPPSDPFSFYVDDVIAPSVRLPDYGITIKPAKQAESSLTVLEYETNGPVPAELRAYYKARSDERHAQRRVRDARKTARTRLIREMRYACVYTKEHFYYKKVIRVHTRPVLKWVANILGYRTVQRRKLVRSIPYRHLVVYYEKVYKGKGDRRRFYKRKVTKTVILHRKVWRIWQERVPNRFGRKQVVIGFKSWYTASRVPVSLGVFTHFNAFQFYCWKQNELASSIEASPEVRTALESLRQAHAATLLASIRAASRKRTTQNAAVHYSPDSLFPRDLDANSAQPSFVSPGVSLPTVSIPVPRIGKWSRTPSSHWPYAIEMIDSSGSSIWGGFPQTQSISLIRLFLGTEFTPYRVDTNLASDSVGVVHDTGPDSQEAQTAQYLTLLRNAEFAYRALMNGDVDKPTDDFNIIRSVGELKDTEQTMRQAKAAFQWMKGRVLDNATATRVGSVLSRVSSLKQGTPKALASSARLASLVRGSPLNLRSSVIALATAYCIAKFAIEPTAEDILTIVDSTWDYVVQIRKGLNQMINGLSSTSDGVLRLRKKFSAPVPYPTRRTGDPVRIYGPLGSEYSFGGPDTSGLPYDQYWVSVGGVRVYDSFSGELDPAAAAHTIMEGVTIPFYHRWAQEVEGVIYAHLGLDDATFLAGQELKGLSAVLADEGDQLDKFADVLTAIQDGVAQSIERSRIFETAWELVPLSFVADWFASTHRTATMVHNLCSALASGSYDMISEAWAAVKTPFIRLTTTVPRITYGQTYVQYSDPVYWRECATKEEYEDPDGPKWSEPKLVGYRSARLMPRDYGADIPALATLHYDTEVRYNTVQLRNFIRGPYQPPASVSQKIHAWMPSINIHINAGKVASLAAIIAGMVAGEESR